MLQVALRPGLRGGKWACLRPLRGFDEVFVNGTGMVEAIAFLDRLLVETPETTVAPGRAKELAICDFDRLYAALYRSCFGDQIEGTSDCRDCAEPFELSVSLTELMAKLESGAAENPTGPDDEGVCVLPDGRRFRLPTVDDQQIVSELEPDQAVAALLERCVLEGDAAKDSGTIQAAMDAVGAVLDLNLDATCPKCGAAQTVRFDIQTHLLRALAYEKRFLHHEVHRIAVAYGWGYEEILRLSREDRRAFVRLIEADRTPRRRTSSWLDT